MNTDSNFWDHTSLQQMSVEQWELLCDGCGICCLHKLEDEDDGSLAFTAVACELLDAETCRCADYNHRQVRVPACRDLRSLYVSGDKTALSGLPASCAYRRLSEGRSLPEWHHLRSGDRDSIHHQGHSVRGRVLSAEHVHPDDYEHCIIHWVEV